MELEGISSQEVQERFQRECQLKLKKKGLVFSGQSNLVLHLAFRNAEAEDRRYFFEADSRNRKADDDYYIIKTRIEKDDLFLWTGSTSVLHQPGWNELLKKSSQAQGSAAQENVFMYQLDNLAIPRYLLKPQNKMPAAVMQATFDTKRRLIISPLTK